MRIQANTRNTFIALFGAVFVFTFFAMPADAATSFFVDQGLDSLSRSSITATLRHEGQNAEYYVEDAYWNGLAASAKNSALGHLEVLSDTFDDDIYGSIRETYGTERTPGIDNNPKITILFTQMSGSLGGYFRGDDQLSSSQEPKSNEREMFYLNTSIIGNIRQMEAFSAHEFQHVVNFNQKNLERDVQEAVWLNELLSETAVSVAGLNSPYNGSNLNSRVSTFLNSPSNSVVKWGATGEDYAAVNVFGHFLLGHYGEDLLRLISQNEKTSIDAVNSALSALGEAAQFKDVFRRWVVAGLVNDCNVLPQDTFCYKNPDLGFDNLHITFGAGTDGGSSVTTQDSTFPWTGRWMSFERTLETTRPEDHILEVTFGKTSSVPFSVPYVVYENGVKPKVFYLTISGNEGKVAIEDFGFTKDKVVVMPINRGSNLETTSSFSVTASLVTQTPQDVTGSKPAANVEANFADGSLLRAEGTEKVYIAKGPYRRWVQSAEIIDMYGHLNFADVITVTPEQLQQYQEVNVIRQAGDERVWWISLDGRKRWIQTEQEFKDLGYTFDMVYLVNNLELSFYPEI